MLFLVLDDLDLDLPVQEHKQGGDSVHVLVPLVLVDLPSDLVAKFEALVSLLVVFLLEVELPDLFMHRARRQAVDSDALLPDPQRLFEALVRLRGRTPQLVQDAEVQETVTARGVQRAELALPDG